MSESPPKKPKRQRRLSPEAVFRQARAAGATSAVYITEGITAGVSFTTAESIPIGSSGEVEEWFKKHAN